MKVFVHFKRALLSIIKSKKIFRSPEYSEILIFDRSDSDAYVGYFEKSSISYLEVRGESINIFVLIRCLSIHKKVNYFLYIKEYVRCVQPKFIFTSIDNNPVFFQLKPCFDHIKIICIQNGCRGPELFHYFEKNENKNLSADYFFCFNYEVGCKYKEYINVSIETIGRIRNNTIIPVRNVVPRTLTFISQFQDNFKNREQTMFNSYGKTVSWTEFYNAERIVLSWLINYLEKKNIVLQICGRSYEKHGSEYQYYQLLLEDCDWKFIPRNHNDCFSNYRVIDDSDYVLFISSTLGYEALARGCKAAAFGIRGSLAEIPEWDFGWPAKISRSGPFWTNNINEVEFKRVMDYVTTVEDQEWEEVRQHHVPQLMEYDPENTKFVNLLSELGAPLKKHYNDLNNNL